MNMKREAIWLIACAAPAVLFCWLAPDYGYSPVPFFTIALYVLSGTMRLLLWALPRWLKRN
jgi:hypothetical protein